VEHGDCDVPPTWAEDLPLGRWVSNQRRHKTKFDAGNPSLNMTAARVAKLDALGFTWLGKQSTVLVVSSIEQRPQALGRTTTARGGDETEEEEEEEEEQDDDEVEDEDDGDGGDCGGGGEDEEEDERNVESTFASGPEFEQYMRLRQPVLSALLPQPGASERVRTTNSLAELFTCTEIADLLGLASDPKSPKLVIAQRLLTALIAPGEYVMKCRYSSKRTRKQLYSYVSLSAFRWKSVPNGILARG
jgi:hypothetical protein